MLIGAVVAGFLLWLAVQVEGATTAGFWAFVGLAAAAGLVLALAQLAGGWTKWGAPRVTGAAFLLGFLPALVLGGWILLAAQPPGAWMQATAEGWATDAGLGGVLASMTAVLPAVAFALGLLFGFTFDTTGPRTDRARPVEPRRDEAVARERVGAHADRAEDEPLRRESEPAYTTRAEDEPVGAERAYEGEGEEERIEEEYRAPDRGFVESLSRDDTPERREGDGTVTGHGTVRDEDVRRAEDQPVDEGGRGDERRL
jgi:hypothetical protein